MMLLPNAKVFFASLDTEVEFSLLVFELAVYLEGGLLTAVEVAALLLCRIRGLLGGLTC